MALRAVIDRERGRVGAGRFGSDRLDDRQQDIALRRVLDGGIDRLLLLNERAEHRFVHAGHREGREVPFRETRIRSGGVVQREQTVGFEEDRPLHCVFVESREQNEVQNGDKHGGMGRIEHDASISHSILAQLLLRNVAVVEIFVCLDDHLPQIQLRLLQLLPVSTALG